MAAGPAWDDQATFEADGKEILAYGVATGLTMETLFSLTDLVEILAQLGGAKADWV